MKCPKCGAEVIDCAGSDFFYCRCGYRGSYAQSSEISRLTAVVEDETKMREQLDAENERLKENETEHLWAIEKQREIIGGYQSEISRLTAENAKLTPRPVVAAVIRNSKNEFLIGKRKQSQWAGGKWCFVGGKIEDAETKQDALKREVLEELGVNVEIRELIHTQIENYEHGTFELNYFDCFLPDGEEPKALDCAEFAITNAYTLASFDLLPVDIDIAKKIREEFVMQDLMEKNAKLQARVEGFEWAIGAKDKQISEFATHIESQGKQISSLTRQLAEAKGEKKSNRLIYDKESKRVVSEDGKISFKPELCTEDSGPIPQPGEK